MSRLKTGARGGEFTLQEYRDAWADTKAELDEMDRLVTCPACGRKTTYGSMMWLNGQSACPACYMARRAAADAERTAAHDT